MRIRRLHAQMARDAVALACVILGALTLWYRAELHGWPWDGPGRLSLCGRYYYAAGSSMSLAALDHQERRQVHLYPVYRALAPIGPEVYSDASPAQRAAPRAPGEPCTGALYTSAWGGYQLYVLSGGP